MLSLNIKKTHYADEEGWYLDYPDGQTVYNRLIEQGVLEAINYNLSAPQRAREEERKTTELREKEMAELARLKSKYEG